MTREELNEYTHLETSLLAIRAEIEATYNTYKSPKFDWNFKNMSSNTGPTPHALERIEKLKERCKEINERLLEIETFVNSIDDPSIRAICTLHYLSGYTWEGTCLKLRNHKGAAVVSKQVQQYFQKKGYETKADS